MIKSFETLGLASSHQPLWARFQTTFNKGRLPHAFLLVGAGSAGLIDFALKMAAALFCVQETRPCGECRSCRLLAAGEHPDLCDIRPEKTGGIIKIDQIRELSELVYRSPQIGDRRIVILSPAEKMNVSAANALLKLLEEPPAFLTFILIAEQLSTLPATIPSRCQLWRFSNNDMLQADYPAMAQAYALDTERGKLFAELGTMIADLQALQSRQQSICTLASKWSKHDMSALIWLIYLINSQMISYHLQGKSQIQPWTDALYNLAQAWHPAELFLQLDKINAVTRLVQKNISLNQTLVIESLLMGYAPC